MANLTGDEHVTDCVKWVRDQTDAISTVFHMISNTMNISGDFLEVITWFISNLTCHYNLLNAADRAKVLAVLKTCLGDEDHSHTVNSLYGLGRIADKAKYEEIKQLASGRTLS